MARMDIDQVIIAHLLLKARTVHYCQHPDGSLDAARVADDGQCALGQWLRAEGARALSSEDFQTLEAEHMAFHRSAAELVRQADGGQAEAVAAGIMPQGLFSQFTYRLVTTLMKHQAVSS